jgi:hypothetical protein
MFISEEGTSRFRSLYQYFSAFYLEFEERFFVVHGNYYIQHLGFIYTSIL